jgi:hypothetical protein
LTGGEQEKEKPMAIQHGEQKERISNFTGAKRTTGQCATSHKVTL